MVELITVIVLLAILGITAGSRMISPSAFRPAIVVQALAAENRIAQQLAVSRRDATVSLTVDRFGADWRLRVATDVDGVIRTELVEAEDSTLHAASGAAIAFVGSGAALSLTFDGRGDLAAVTIDGAAGDPSLGIDLTVGGDHERRLCIYPSGYAHREPCR